MLGNQQRGRPLRPSPPSTSVGKAYTTQRRTTTPAFLDRAELGSHQNNEFVALSARGYSVKRFLLMSRRHMAYTVNIRSFLKL